jgi:predicted metal-dependent peptidase
MAIIAKPHFENAFPEMSGKDEHACGVLTLRSKARMLWRYMCKHQIIWTTSIPTAAADGVYIYVNPEFYLSLPSHGQRAFLLGHEVLHILLRHAWRRMAMQKQGFFRQHKTLGEIPFIMKLWNYGTDAIINDELVSLGLEPIDGAIRDDRFNRNSVAEEVYLELYEEWLEKQQDDPEDESGDDSNGDPSDSMGNPSPDSSGNGAGDDTDDDATGDMSGENDSAGDQAGDQAGEYDGHDVHDLDPIYEGTEEEIAEARREEQSASDRNLRESVKEYQEAVERGECRDTGLGCGIDGEVTASENRHTAQINYRDELADVFHLAGAGTDVTYSTMHRRRYNVMGIVTPATVGSLTHVTVINDISSSVDRNVMRDTLAEIAHLTDEVAPTDGVTIMNTNHEVRESNVHHCHSGGEITDLDIPCGGGTELSKALDYMEENGIQSEVILAFTDGQLWHEDMQRLADAGVIIILDSVPDRWTKGDLEKTGARYIVAVDESAAA